MSDFTTNGPVVLIAHSHVQHPDSIEGVEVALTAGYLAASVTMWHAPVEAAANTNPGRFSIYLNRHATRDDLWEHKIDLEVGTGTAATEAMTATEPAAEKVLAVASTTGFAARDKLYVQDTNAGSPTSTTGSLGSPETLSEWHACDKIVANTSIDIMAGLVNEKDSSDVIWNLAQFFQFNVEPGWARVRCDFSHEGAAGANVHVKAELNEITDIE